MAEQDTGDTMVEIEYHTPDRWGQRYAVPLREALTTHKEARIVGRADGSSFVGPEATAEVKETRADIRAERAAAREEKAAAEEAAKADEP